MTPDPAYSIEIFADADFCGLYNPETALYDPVTAKSRTGYIVKYMGCPIVWASRLQTETALSTTEAEYIRCSEALRTVIPLMDLLKEARSHGIQVATPKTKILCKLFCDNSGACELIRLPKFRPRTKHINTKLHHFRKHVASGHISVQFVPTTEQQGDIATKPLTVSLFDKFRKLILGWSRDSLNIRRGSMGFIDIFHDVIRTYQFYSDVNLAYVNFCNLSHSHLSPEMHTTRKASTSEGSLYVLYM
jgi:hypothetical protein